MKKTMFITSVIMVVVLAIALTTSSLAWFNATGQSSVATSNISIQATSAPDAAGLQIALANTGYTDYGNSVSFANTVVGSSLNPAGVIYNKSEGFAAADLVAALENTTAINSADPAFSTGLESGRIFQGYFRTVEEAVKFKNDTLYVGNNGTQAATVSCDIKFFNDAGAAYDPAADGHGDDAKLWVAVVAILPGETPTHQLVALECSKGDQATNGPAAFVAPLIANANASKDDGLGATATSAVIRPVIAGSNFGVGAGIPHSVTGEMIVDTTKAVQIVTYAWFDGSSLYNGNANTGVYKISLEFSLV